METVSYKATVINTDPNKAPDPSVRGYGERTFTHKERAVVDHWVDHIYIEYPEAYVRVVKVTEGPVDG